MGFIDALFGRPLASSEDQGERITPLQGIPVFGLDALSSAAYGPEAALTIPWLWPAAHTFAHRARAAGSQSPGRDTIADTLWGG